MTLRRHVTAAWVAIVPVLLLILALGGCGGDISSDEGETPSETGGEKAAPAEVGGRGSTAARTGGREAIPTDVLSITVGLIPSGDSSASGTAVLTDTSDGLEVTLNMQDLPGQSGAEYLTHIHEGGACVDSGAGADVPIGYPLEPVTGEQDGTGSSTTVLPDITVVQLFLGAPKYVDVHDTSTGDEFPLAISCANIYTSTGGD